MAKDFRNKTFPKILRGYAPDVVDEYIARINTEYGRLERRLSETEKKLAAAVDKLDKADTNNIGEKEAGTRAAADAKEAAVKIIAEAQKTAESIVKQAEKRADELESEARRLADRVYSFRDMLFDAYNSHIEDIERVMGEVDALTGRGVSDHGTDDAYGDDDGEEDSAGKYYSEPKTAFVGGDLFIDPAEYEDGGAADDTADAKEEERRRRLDRLFGISDDDDDSVSSSSENGLSPNDSGAGESSDENSGSTYDDGDTRVLDLGELLRENRKTAAESEKTPDDSAQGDGGSDFGTTSSDSEFSDFGSDEIDSILGKKVRALNDEFGVVYSDEVYSDEGCSDEGIPHERNGKKEKGRR